MHVSGLRPRIRRRTNKWKEMTGGLGDGLGTPPSSWSGTWNSQPSVSTRAFGYLLLYGMCTVFRF